jgi:putative transposase
MHFEPEHVYHVYNRGNNKTNIFFFPKNYLYFLQKIKNEWLTYCDIYCYCLMPNHFHFMLQPNQDGCETVVLKGKTTHLQKLSKTIGKTLSSYTQAINLQNRTTGNLFQQKTKAKCLTEPSNIATPYYVQDYLANCFFYIHNNPLAANIVSHLKQWPHSSWPDYYGFRNGTLCNKQKAMQQLGLTEIDFMKTQHEAPIKEMIQLFW